MRSNVFAVLAFAAMASASAIPHAEPEMSLRERSPLEARDDSYDCKGSSVCGTVKVAYCDKAVNENLIRDDVVRYGAPG